ncbi:MAG: MFS transporter [Bdellovibrio sp.]|nr:MAG: MFS transporter [Bdellovibrio sp.]
MKSKINLLSIAIPSLGYFVDIYDLLLFGIVRVPSLVSIGVPESETMTVGVRLLNMQLVGMLLGGVLWGVMGDRRGRKSVLFGSILLYSLCNLANAWVSNVEAYAWLRFFAGFGLAGELGAAITLVSESVPARWRGYATSIVAGVGVSGAVFASLISHYFSWQVAYTLGGLMGLGLLVLRARLAESILFSRMQQDQTTVPPWFLKRRFFALFLQCRLLRKYLACIAAGGPVWYVIGILVTFSPEIAQSLGVSETVSSGTAFFWAYVGATVGDFTTGLVAQYLQSRIKAIYLYLTCSAVSVATLFAWPGLTAPGFYLFCLLAGTTTGYWASLITLAAEQFGTNLRATVATSVPNFIRGSGVLMTLGLSVLRPHWGLIYACLGVGVVVFALSLLALLQLEETFAKDLNYYE